MRMPMKPVSFMTSRISVNATRGNEFHRLAPSAHRTFLLAGRRPAARASVVPKRASAVRRVIVTDVTRFAPRLPGVVGMVGRRGGPAWWAGGPPSEFGVRPRRPLPAQGVYSYSAARSTVHTLAQMGPPILKVAAARGFGACKPAGALP